MTLFSEESIVRGLMAVGVPREKAELEAKRQCAGTGASATVFVDRCLTVPECRTLQNTLVDVSIAWPVRILVPWSHLVSDNERKEPYIVHVDGKPRARMRLSRKYAAAMEKIANLAKNKVGDALPYAGPLAIRALVWVPDEHPHDVANFEKLGHDALEGVVYTNDRWLHDIHWTRAGVDVDAPRAEITITPIPG